MRMKINESDDDAWIAAASSSAYIRDSARAEAGRSDRRHGSPACWRAQGGQAYGNPTALVADAIHGSDPDGLRERVLAVARQRVRPQRTGKNACLPRVTAEQLHRPIADRLLIAGSEHEPHAAGRGVARRAHRRARGRCGVEPRRRGDERGLGVDLRREAHREGIADWHAGLQRAHAEVYVPRSARLVARNEDLVDDLRRRPRLGWTRGLRADLAREESGPDVAALDILLDP